MYMYFRRIFVLVSAQENLMAAWKKAQGHKTMLHTSMIFSPVGLDLLCHPMDWEEKEKAPCVLVLVELPK